MSPKELLSDASFEEFFRHMVEVLCGKRDPLFRYERELRLCQLKVWLLEDDDDLKSVQNATMIFAAALISRRMIVLRNKNEGLPSSVFKRVLRNSGYRTLFNFGFVAPGTLYSLTRILSFSSRPLAVLPPLTVRAFTPWCEPIFCIAIPLRWMTATRVRHFSGP
jgi:hypothetical protein